MSLDDLLRIVFYVYEKSPTVDPIKFRKALFEVLDDRERDVIMARYGIGVESQTLDQIAGWLQPRPIYKHTATQCYKQHTS